MIKEVTFNGEAGRLEGRYHQSESRNVPAALVLHPHPLHGGTMNSKVVYHTFHTLVKNNFSVLRFNFRGVGKSLGTFDHGNGEMIDAATALDWLKFRNPEASSYWIIGFSFGAWIAMQLLMRRPEIDFFIVIAPPASSYDFSFLSPCPIPGLIIQGALDNIAKEQDSYSLYTKLLKQPKQRKLEIEYELIEDADHVFTNHEKILISTIDQFVKPRIARPSQPKKVRRDRKRKLT